jgi:hypothetical protein
MKNDFDIHQWRANFLKEDIGQELHYQGDRTEVKITKCDNPMYWYKDFVGQKFTAVPDNSGTKWTDGKEKWKIVPDKRIPSGVRYINKEDTQSV